MKVCDLSGYRSFLEDSGKSKNTVDKYVMDVSSFISFLDGEDISRDTVLRFKKYLLKDHKVRSAKSILSSVNSYLEYSGRPECKVPTGYPDEKVAEEQKEDLTLGEYYRLLSVAQKKGKQQLLLILQVLLTMGLKTGELELVTVEAIRAGELAVGSRQERLIAIPDKLNAALVSYISEKGLKSGSVFITVHGTPIGRSNLLRQIKRLCRDARVDEDKVNPGSLRHLFACYYYEKTQSIEQLGEALGVKDLNIVKSYIGQNKKGKALAFPTDDLAL